LATRFHRFDEAETVVIGDALGFLMVSITQLAAA
jgi:hypothetical protein